MGLAEDLIEQASHLATRDIAGRPGQASLRRAVSTAYYSLFHFLTDQASRLVVGRQDLPLRAMMARAFNHSVMKTTAAEFVRGKLPDRAIPALGGHPIPAELKSIADAFVTLQEFRHDADYNLSYRFERERVELLIEQVQQAIDLWPHIQNSPAAKLFLYLLLVGDRVKGR